MAPSSDQEKATAIVLFDGECNLCYGLLRFIVRRDRRGRFRFADLRSAVARRFLARVGQADSLDTVILVLGPRTHLHSGAVLRIFARLRWPWPLLSVLLAVPWPLRDWFYRLVAANRRRWFGRRDSSCAVPKELRSRWIDEADLPDRLSRGGADLQQGV